MKFYNPWKPHIVKDGNGRYYIRQMSLIFWLYLQERENWSDKDTGLCCDYRSYTEAYKELMSYKCRQYNAKLFRENSKREKVIHEN